MNSPQPTKLLSAVAPVTAAVSTTMRENARFCTEMRAQNIEKNKTNPPRPLAPRQLMAAQLLVRGKTVAAAARELSVNQCTIRRWKSDARFATEIQRLIDLRQSPHPKPKPRRMLDPIEKDEPLSPRLQQFRDRMRAERNAWKCAHLRGFARVEQPENAERTQLSVEGGL